MTVSELIEALSDMPQNMPVHFWANGERQTIIEVSNVGDCVDLYEEEEEMTYAEKARAWVQNAPEADIHIGKFTLKYQYGYDRDWGASWVCYDGFDLDTPESNYFNEICDALSASQSDMSFIDELLEAMKNKPFNQGESK